MADTSRLPTPVAEEWDWQQRAACRDYDSTLFFHPDSERGTVKRAREERAKAICRRCPVIVECRQHALAVGEPYGVWGAMTAHERIDFLSRHGERRRARRRAVAGASASGGR